MYTKTSGGVTTTYTYDGAGRLTSESSATSSISYAYDAANNRTSMVNNGTLTTYTYDANNRMLTETEGSTTKTYTYDANGNQLTGDGATYTYNARGQQSGYSKGGVSASYTYLPTGLRKSKTVGFTTTNYVWDGQNMVYEYNGTNTAGGTPYYYGLMLISLKNDAYYLYNAHGDVVQLISSTGSLGLSYNYDAFGNEVNPSATDTNPFRYAGQYYDKETGTYYLRARYYDPSVGRFTQQDPIMDGLNWYVYANNNPLKYVDPTGLSSEEKLGKGIWSLKNDEFGISILYHWLFGGGFDYVHKDGMWGTYMKDNSLLKTKVQEIVLPLANDVKNNSSKPINITISMVIQNGEDIIGYQYLHGTNADVGGFHIKGIVSKNKKGDITYDLIYTWNDRIDPNFEYYSDSKKAEFAKKIPFANSTDYTIRITWSDKTVIKANPTWYNRNKGWLK